MADKVMMAVDTGESLRQTELLVLGQMRDTMRDMTTELVANRNKLAAVAEDVAGIKQSVAATAKLEQKVGDLEDEVADLKMRNAKQDGATALLQFAKDYGGWFVGLGTLAYGLFLHH